MNFLMNPRLFPIKKLWRALSQASIILLTALYDIVFFLGMSVFLQFVNPLIISWLGIANLMQAAGL